MRCHTCPEKSHNCAECGGNYPNEENLNEHRCSRRSCECGDCGRVFQNTSDLGSHTCQQANESGLLNDSDATINWYNEDAKSNSCGKDFPSSENPHHYMNGGEEYVHQCPQCHLRFAVEEHLAMHICRPESMVRTLLNGVDEYRCQCPLSSQQFCLCCLFMTFITFVYFCCWIQQNWQLWQNC